MRSVTKRLGRVAALYVGLPLFVGAFLGSGTPAGRLLAQVGDPSNPIAAENALPGDSTWDLPGANPNSGDSTIQGFATDISVNKGDTVHFKINTDSASYGIDIYRLGYYGGAGARKLTATPIVINHVQTQPPCTADGATGLYDCGTWSESASWAVPATAVSGVYLAKLTRYDGIIGGSSHIVFIVRDDARKADLLFQTSDTTWQAYNQYPGPASGGSLYCGIGLSNANTEYIKNCGARAAKVSYNRPFDTRNHDARSFLFGAEQPMIVWLEKNGYDVKYWSAVDTDRRGGDLLNPAIRPNAFLSVGHDEYWSEAQRGNVENARNAGVNLAFFSGNEMYWKTRWEPSIDGSATANRTLVSYKETMADGVGGKIDPTATWTGTWRDPRFAAPPEGGRPENAVSGQIWTVNCCGTSMEIPEADGKMRFWRDTDIATLASGTTATLADGANILGYEWDEDLDNGARPAGIVHMSTTTRNGAPTVTEHLIDYGITFTPGVATHHLTLYRHASGALVFGAGTIRWSWGLDASHDAVVADGEGWPTPDSRMQQATVNLLADMSVGAGTLQSGLTAATKSLDIYPPTSQVTSPSSGASLPSGSPVTVTGTAIEVGGGHIGGVEVSVDGGQTWHPATGRDLWSYTFTPSSMGPTVIWSRAVDDSGNIEDGTTNTDASGHPLPPTKSAGTSASVTVSEPICPCNIWPDAPTPGTPSKSDGAVEVGVKFKADISGYVTGLRFYKGDTTTGTQIVHLWTASGTLLSEAVFTGASVSGWQEVALPWPVAIQGGSTYVASYHTTTSYAVDNDYFALSGHDTGVLHALVSVDTPTDHSQANGVFKYGPSSFPTDTFASSNYWVDIVFNTTPAGDVTPPVITGLTVTPNGDGTATFSWSTAEPSTSTVLFGSTPGMLTGTAGDSTPVSQHVVTLNGLAAPETYYFQVRSTDAAGNSATTAEDNFVLPQPGFRDTTIADFSLGTPAGGAKVAPVGDGAVVMPVYGSDFSAGVLPPGWTSCLWSPASTPSGVVCGSVGAGSVTLTNGLLRVDGGRVDTNLFATAGRSIEFDATFDGEANQHIGFGLTFEDPPWAFFSIPWFDAQQLYARTDSGSGQSAQTVILPPAGTSWFGTPHHFKVEWLADRVVYTISDGATVLGQVEHDIAITASMQPIVASDLTASVKSIAVDSFWVGEPYATTASFESRVYDAGASVKWGAFSWTGTAAPPTTTLALSYRMGDTPTLTGWTPVSASGSQIGLSARYIQYRADFTSSDPGATPVLNDVTIEFAAPASNNAPVANNDTYSTNQDTALSVPAPGVIANDTDANGDPLTASLAGGPSHGSLALHPDGSFIYMPAANYSGIDSFTYTVTDAHAAVSNVATVTIVVKATPTITWSNPGDITYGTALSSTQLNATASPAGTFVYTPPSGTVLSAGNSQTLSVTFTPTDTLNYTTASKTVLINVAKATPVVSWATPSDITYGTALSTQLNATVSVPGTLTYSPVAGTTLNAGNAQTLSVSFAPTDTSNYTTATKNVSISVLKALASVTPNVASKTYGGVDPALTGTLSGFLMADGVTATYARTAGETVAGSSYTISATLSPAGVLGNYTITYNTATFTITTAAATVTAGGGTKVYGTADPALSATTQSGFTTADASTITLTSTRASGDAVASYATTATAAGAALSNYTVTYVAGTFTITTKTATVTAGGGTKVYGAGDPALSATTQTGFTAADASTIALTSTRASGETVGSYATTATATGAAFSNYTVTYVPGTFNITKATASVTPSAASKTYGSADPAFSGTLSGFLSGDNVAASYSRAAGETVAGGPYTISATLSPAAVLANYTITYNTASFTIGPKAASVTPNAASKTYGSADPALSGTMSGFLPADGVTATYSRAAGETVAGSPYQISDPLSPAGVLSNYTITYNTASFTINKAQLTVTANNQTKTYGAANPTLAVSYSGFVNGDTAASLTTPPTVSTTATAASTVGTYPITASGAVGANYTMSYVSGTLTITKATPTITWGNPANITYGMALSGTQLNATATMAGAFVYNPAFGSVLNGGNGQTLSVSFTPTDTTNYNSANKSVTINVLKATPTVTWNNPSDITEGTALSSTQLNATATVAGSFTYSPVSGTALNVGNNQTLSVTFTPTDTSNYTTATKTASINVLNVAPVAGPITWNAAVDLGIPINTAVIASASFTDPGAADTHTATINWGDTSTTAASVTETNGNGSVSGTHTYTATGLYTAVLTVTDNHGGVGQSSYTYVVVVNPTGGSEVGMGSFASPLGAYTRNTALSGSVTLTQLSAKYATDGTMNLGTNAFRLSYSPASISLTSTKMIWFVKTTTGKSWLKGEGTLVTGSTPETVGYLLSVVDSTSVADKVRVKIWNKATGIVIYDNQPGAPDNADATQAVSTGPGTVTFMP